MAVCCNRLPTPIPTSSCVPITLQSGTDAAVVGASTASLNSEGSAETRCALISARPTLWDPGTVVELGPTAHATAGALSQGASRSIYDVRRATHSLKLFSHCASDIDAATIQQPGF